jgi:MraZ protein
MLIGEYDHSIDEKGRINFPSKLREELGPEFIITKGLDECLYVYSLEEWAKLEAQINSQPNAKARGLRRFFFASAAAAAPDKQGRVLIAQKLREYAGLKENVTIVGVSNHAEIWDRARWAESSLDLPSEAIVSVMDELGF